MAASALLASAAVHPAAISAQGPHPHYLSARTDLKTLQLLARIQEQPNVSLSLEAAAAKSERQQRDRQPPTHRRQAGAPGSFPHDGGFALGRTSSRRKAIRAPGSGAAQRSSTSTQMPA